MEYKVGDRVRADLRGTTSSWRKNGYAVELGIVKDCGYPFYKIELVSHVSDDDCIWFAREEQLSPALPDGWTPADEPPDGCRDVHILTPVGERNGWYFIGAKKWQIYNENFMGARHAAPGEVLGWREIETERPSLVRLKVGQRVRVKRNGLTGWVVDDDGSSIPYHVVSGENGVDSWFMRSSLEPIPDPAPQPKKLADEYVVVNIRQRFDSFEAAEADALREVDKNGVQFVVARIVELVNPGKPEVIRIEE